MAYKVVYTDPRNNVVDSQFDAEHFTVDAGGHFDHRQANQRCRCIPAGAMVVCPR
ncbi:hypothetical protein [Nocardia farcinica]|uniref:hypothetical protein n=1 Tax=Nocardia farcinica TaxID=37329 RepID=UPI0037A7240A